MRPQQFAAENMAENEAELNATCASMRPQQFAAENRLAARCGRLADALLQ